MSGFKTRLSTLFTVFIVSASDSSNTSLSVEGGDPSQRHWMPTNRSDERRIGRSELTESVDIPPRNFLLRKSGHSISRTPRLELRHPPESDGAELWVFNIDLLNTTDPLEANFACTVVGGHLQWSKGRWEPITHVILYQQEHTHVEEWRKPPELLGDYPEILQTKLTLSIAYEVEGLLTCRDRLGQGLVSNSLLIRFDYREAFVVSLGKPRHEIDIIDILYDYKNLTNFSMNCHLLKEEKSKFLIRISYAKPSDEVTIASMMAEVKNASKIIAKNGGLRVIFVRNTRICNPEGAENFKWPETLVGKTAVPENPCVNREGVPQLRRRCLGDFFKGTYWERAPKRPKECHKMDERADRLKNISVSKKKTGALRKLENELRKTDEPLKAGEILDVANTMKSYKNEMKKAESVEEVNVSSVVAVVDAILRSDKEVVSYADSISGSSSDILVAVDELIAASAADVPSEASTPLFSALAIPTGTGIRGFAVYPDDPSEKLTPISRNETLESLLRKSPRVAAYLYQGQDDAGLVSTLFQADTLFGSSNGTATVQGPVIGLSQFRKDTSDKDEPQSTTQVLLIFPEGKQKGNCSFWDLRAGGKWSSEGCFPVSSSELPGSPNVDACLCNHLTHFALLFMDHPFGGDYFAFSHVSSGIQGKGENSTLGNEDSDSERVLRLITEVGCYFSLCCLFATVILRPKCSRGVYQKIELNFLASIALLDAAELVVVSSKFTFTSTFREVCVSMGVLLHYSVLATFMWMLVAAGLQSLKLSPGTILDARRRAGNHLLLKVSIFAWGFPAIPVVCTLCFGTGLYVQRPKTAFCYPRGVAFYAGVLFPVALAVFLNFCVFAWILRVLICTKTATLKVHGVSKRERTIRRLRYCIFLFFLFGLNWITGMFLELSRPNELIHTILSYIFCTAATLHGSSLFLFIVVCEPRSVNKLSEDFGKFIRRTSITPLYLRSTQLSQSSMAEKRLAMFQDSESREENSFKY